MQAELRLDRADSEAGYLTRQRARTCVFSGGATERSTWSSSAMGEVPLQAAGFDFTHQHGSGWPIAGVLASAIAQRGRTVSVCDAVPTSWVSLTAQSSWMPGVTGSMSVSSTLPERQGFATVMMRLPMSVSVCE